MLFISRSSAPRDQSSEHTETVLAFCFRHGNFLQEGPVVADKPARRESMPKLLQFDVLTAYNVVADNRYWSVFIRLAVVASEICEILRNSLKIQNL